LRRHFRCVETNSSTDQDEILSLHVPGLLTRPWAHEAKAEAEARKSEAEVEAETTESEAEAEAEASYHEAEAKAEATN